MKKLNPRFWSSETKEYRELLKVETNAHGDIVMTLDGGEVWQYTPHQPTPLFTKERLKICGRGVITNGMNSGKKGLYCFLHLQNPTEKLTGNLRIIPPPAQHSERLKPRESKRGEVTQKEAAIICEVTERTIRNWQRGINTPEGWPGLTSSVDLKIWSDKKEQSAKTKHALLNMVHVGDIDKMPHRQRNTNY